MWEFLESFNLIDRLVDSNVQIEHTLSHCLYCFYMYHARRCIKECTYIWKCHTTRLLIILKCFDNDSKNNDNPRSASRAVFATSLSISFAVSPSREQIDILMKIQALRAERPEISRELESITRNPPR